MACPNRFAAWGRLSIGLALALLGNGAQACPVQFSGSDFLAVAGRQGMAPTQEECVAASAGSNYFVALPDRACTLFFADADWLRAGMTFKAFDGVGRFSQKRVAGPASGIRVTVKGGGGFLAQGVAIETGDEDLKTCKHLRPSDVLQ
jgi:hypothetical protein